VLEVQDQVTVVEVELMMKAHQMVGEMMEEMDILDHSMVVAVVVVPVEQVLILQDPLVVVEEEGYNIRR
jgi:hypothetical protein|tara:strand:- start:611 stop:817 length:207 start_codon:yes stop_codon:yes gene_type:complete